MSAVDKFLWDLGRCEAECFLLAKGKNAKADSQKHAKRFPLWRERGTIEDGGK